MLTATYSMVALSIEQRTAHSILSTLQQTIKTSGLDAIGPNGLESAVDKLSRFDQYCHDRKVELYVIPVIRKVTREADSLLAELESLSSCGFDILRSLRDELRSALDHGIAKIEELYRSMDLYCSNLLQRLIKEEELLKIARRVISGEDWFSIAANFLSYDAEHDRRRRHVHAGPGLPLRSNTTSPV
jgi:hemerythrin-like domain-containing protein